MRFDPSVALEYAQDIAKPRRVGSPANEAVIAALADRLASFGCTVDVEAFELSSWGERAPAFHILAAQLLILITFWIGTYSARAAVVPALLLAALVLAAGRIYRFIAWASLRPADLAGLPGWRRWWLGHGPLYRTANIVARVPQGTGNHPSWPLLLVAHSDSKGQPLSLVARMSLIAAASLAALVFVGFAILRIALPEVKTAAAGAGLVALLTGVPLLFLFLAGSGNASPGAIDNASGAGLVLHLAECLCADPPESAVRILITGAEELGLLGALAFVHRQEPKALQGLRVLNFDGIGTAGKLALVAGAGSLLAEQVRAVCRAQSIPLGWLPLVGAQYDHLPFADVGLEAATLITTGMAALSVHTPNDDVHQLDADGFRRAGKVALSVIKGIGQSEAGAQN